MFGEWKKDRQESDARKTSGERQVLQLKSNCRRLVARGRQEIQDVSESCAFDLATESGSQG